MDYLEAQWGQIHQEEQLEVREEVGVPAPDPHSLGY